MKTDELRESYLSFFESKGCVRRPSDVLVPRDDPTVLFTPAGMNQFKNQFLGVGQLDFTRATTCQKCLRTGDIENVGATAYHHTLFEMLGNFSFGDYFKRDAIHWAWEYLTDKKWLGLDPQALSVTVYLEDNEAYDIWHDEIKMPAERLRRDNEYENFWPAGAPSNGPDGVCGPCSEIFFQPEDGSSPVEIWNLVFTQFNRVGAPPDNLRPLPKKNIDTGMGLERTAAVLQGCVSNFEIDILKPLCLAAAEVVGVNYKFDAPQGRAVRRIADHVRAITFAIHEGIVPDNKDAGYVIRQLLRRAMLEGFLLGQHDPFLHQIVPAVVDVMKAPYPELTQTIESVSNSIHEEEKDFVGTIERGLPKFQRLVDEASSQGRKVISGDQVFDLHQTDGFLVELSQAIAIQNDMTVDREQFDARMKEHEATSGRGLFADAVMATGPLDALRQDSGGTQFLGYETTESESKVIGVVYEKQLVEQLDTTDQLAAVVLNQTPFYGEAGGQVGDTGSISAEGAEFEVLDTQKDGDLILHFGKLTSGVLKVGTNVQAKATATRREGIRRAHSATHILHHALRQTLGENATQRGSKVEQDALRFDFAHNTGLTETQLIEIEDEINTRVAEGADVTTRLMDIKSAKAAGAMALFGEKYPDEVRVVSMGDFSVELCGGIHLSNTGQVGLFKLVSDELIAKGVRRITALTGPKAFERIRQTENLLKELVIILKTPQPEDLPRRVKILQDELRTLKRDLTQQSSRSIAGMVDELVSSAEVINGVSIVVHELKDANRDALRDFIDQVRAKTPQSAVLVGTANDGKVSLTAAVSKEVVKQGLKASDCVRAAAKIVGGGGGGRPDMAEAGGKLPEKLSEALAEGAKFYRDQLQA